MALTGLNPIPPNDLVMGCPPACGGRGSFAKLILSWDLPDVTWLAPPLLKTYDCRVSDLFVFLQSSLSRDILLSSGCNCSKYH